MYNLLTTHWSLGDKAVIIDNCQIHILRILWNSHQVAAQDPCDVCQLFSGNGLVTPVNKSLPEPRLTKFYGIMRRH